MASVLADLERLSRQASAPVSIDLEVSVLKERAEQVSGDERIAVEIGEKGCGASYNLAQAKITIDPELATLRPKMQEASTAEQEEVVHEAQEALQRRVEEVVDELAAYHGHNLDIARQRQERADQLQKRLGVSPERAMQLAVLVGSR